jgi:hypothetical protein
MAPVLEGTSIGSDQTWAKRRAPDLICRTKNQVQSLRIQLKDSICFKSVQIAS